MRIIKGQLKLQCDLFFVHEMLEFKPVTSEAYASIAGYAIFDLQYQRVSRFCLFYNDVIAEVKSLSMNAQVQKSLLAA